jgi:hypothetical protein
LSAAAAPGLAALGLRFTQDLIRKISEESRNAGINLILSKVPVFLISLEILNSMSVCSLEDIEDIPIAVFCNLKGFNFFEGFDSKVSNSNVRVTKK